MLNAHIKDDFNNLLEYHAWVNKTIENISGKNKMRISYFSENETSYLIRRQPDWFGSDVTYEQLKKGITEYSDPELIEKVYSQVNDRISTAVRDKVKARKVNYNPSGLGVFVFDRAAMGMYRLKEFYSPSLKKVFEKEEVRQTKNGFVLISDGSAVIERWEEKQDGKPKIRTSNKNVYAYFPKVSKERQAVELYISCGGHVGIKAQQFLYSGISAIIIAQILEKARIQTKISIIIGSSPDGFTENAYGCLIPVKNYGETLDINLLALLSSDPRFFRFEGFKGIVSIYDHFKQTMPSSFGKGMTTEYLEQVIEKSSYTKRANLAPNRFYFGWTFNEANAISAINDTIEEIAKRLQS